MAEAETWVPLGIDDEQYVALVEGIPDHMEVSFWQWVQKRMTQLVGADHYFDPYEAFNADLLREIERRCRIRAPYDGETISSGMQSLRQGCAGDPMAALRVADFLVRAVPSSGATLEQILAESSSAWSVGERAGGPGLVRRVPEGVQLAAEEAMRAPGHAGPRLAQAWQAVYGLDKNPTHAYAMAVKAVEDATIPLLVPKQTNANLGHVIGQLKKDANWSLPLTREHPDAPTSETIIRMLQGLWKGHHDRHGGDPNAPQSVSQEEAEAAVMLAVPLVHWFASGVAARRP